MTLGTQFSNYDVDAINERYYCVKKNIIIIVSEQDGMMPLKF